MPNHDLTAWEADRDARLETEAAKADGPYSVRVAGVGCRHCGAGVRWTIINPDGVAIGDAYDRASHAYDMADRLNWAFARGVISAKDRA
jgi:hypothetical protein